MRLQQTLEKYLPLISAMMFPASLFAVGLFCFLIKGNFEFDTAKIFHICFYIINFLSLVILLNFNRGRPLFFMTVIFISYVLLNYLKNKYGTDFKTTIWYQNLSILIPANLIFFYGYFIRRFFCRHSLFILLGLSAEYSIGEFLGRQGYNLCFYWQGYNIISILLFCFLSLWSFINSVKKGKLFDYSVLFSGLSVGLGFYFSNISSGLSMFFFIAQLIMSVYLIYNLTYCHFYDDLTGVYSRNSYLMQSKHFPLKYSLIIVSIDNYNKLSAVIGRNNLNIITTMLTSILEELSAEDSIYRYNDDEFIIICKKLDKKEAFSKAETIRRTIAGINFEYLPDKKPLKLTVSCSVAEKKRSDSGAVEVLLRADKAMRKTLKFSHNVTSQG